MNAYEVARLQNIAKNQDALRKLGLLDSENMRINNKRSRPIENAKKGNNGIKQEHVDAAPPPRRSPRVAASTQIPDYRIPDDNFIERRPKKNTNSKNSYQEIAVKMEIPIKLELQEPIVHDQFEIVRSSGYSDLSFGKIESSQFARNNDERIPCKDIRLKLDQVCNQFLGKVILPPPGSGAAKEAAMNSIAEKPPRFSKYSGIQIFKNGIALFVNAAPASVAQKYSNMFQIDSENLIEICWFAQPRHTEETPVVQMLQDPRTSVLLFCRLPAEAYVCCGRVSLKEFFPNESPLKFIWQITDSKTLLQSPAFNDIIAFASGDAVKIEA